MAAVSSPSCLQLIQLLTHAHRDLLHTEDRQHHSYYFLSCSQQKGEEEHIGSLKKAPDVWSLWVLLIIAHVCCIATLIKKKSVRATVPKFK